MGFKTASILSILLIFCAICITDACTQENNSASEWFPFETIKKLNPESAVNIGKDVLDAWAGIHGFLQVKGKNFFFSDGTQAKFWGTNLVFNACFPPKELASAIAERLAFFGFNAVRMHHMDSDFSPRGIFLDTCPECTDPQMKKTGILSPEQMDRLDYLIYQLKIRGIYVDINLLVSRHFTYADAVTDAQYLQMAAKPASLFDEKLIDLQKNYAFTLLTHYNPYTKLKYCDDPAIILVEITNENSLSADTSKLPTYYAAQLQDKWNKFPKGKYKDDSEAKKDFYIKIEQQYFDEMINFLKKECFIKVPITGVGGFQGQIDIEAQKNCDFLDAHGYWDHPYFPRKVWDREDFTISNKSLLLDKNSGMIGKLTANFPQPKIKPYTVSEWSHCYPNQYAYETPIFLAAQGLKQGWDGLFQFAFKHGISADTDFNQIDSYFDIMNNPQQLMLCSLASIVFLKEKVTNVSVKEGIFTIKGSLIKGAIGFIKNIPLRLEPFIITANQDGTVLFYKKPHGFLLYVLSEVRNTASGWDNTGKFNWGRAPVLLKNISLEVNIKAQNKLKVYLLDESGNRLKEIGVTYSKNAASFSIDGENSAWFEIVTE